MAVYLNNGETLRSYLVTKQGQILEIIDHDNTGFETVYQTKTIPYKQGYYWTIRHENIKFFFNLYENKEGQLYYPVNHHDCSAYYEGNRHCCICGKEILTDPNMPSGHYCGNNPWPLYDYETTNFVVCDECYPLIADIRIKIIEAQNHIIK